MSFTAQDVMKLRQMTGAGLMAAKRALEESAGDIDKAVDILRISGEAKAAKKADRETVEGAVFTICSADNTRGVIVSLGCETDFVARNDEFQGLIRDIAQKALSDGEQAAHDLAAVRVPEVIVTSGENIKVAGIRVVEAPYVNAYVHSNGKTGALVALSVAHEEAARSIAMHVVASSPKYLDPSEVSTDDIDREKAIWKEQLINEGKPADMVDKILAGKVAKYAGEVSLKAQPFVMDPSSTVEKYAQSVGAQVLGFAHLSI